MPRGSQRFLAQAAAYNQAIDYLRDLGTLVVVGLPNDNLTAPIFFTVLKSITIKGSYVGNRQDAFEALDAAARGKVKVYYQTRGLTDLQAYVLSSFSSLYRNESSS